MPKFACICLNDEPFLLDFVNPHQGFTILHRHQLLQLDESCDYFDQNASLLGSPRYIREYMSSISVSSLPVLAPASYISQIFQSDQIVKYILEIPESGDLYCNIKKVIPARSWFDFAVHHQRQRYAHKFPIVTIHDVHDSFITFARDSTAREWGEIPQCWRDYVDSLDPN